MTRTYKMALITGATQGIGEAFVEILPAATGLLLTGRDAAKLVELAERHARSGRTIETVTADLTEEEKQIGSCYFARSPGGLCVSFHDLPEATKAALWERINRGELNDYDVPF